MYREKFGTTGQIYQQEIAQTLNLKKCKPLQRRNTNNAPSIENLLCASIQGCPDFVLVLCTSCQGRYGLHQSKHNVTLFLLVLSGTAKLGQSLCELFVQNRKDGNIALNWRYNYGNVSIGGNNIYTYLLQVNSVTVWTLFLPVTICYIPNYPCDILIVRKITISVFDQRIFSKFQENKRRSDFKGGIGQVKYFQSIDKSKVHISQIVFNRV